MRIIVVLAILIAIFNGLSCQVYYQPVQVLIPTVNGSTYLATNYSIYNNTNVPANRTQGGNYSNVNNTNWDNNYFNNNGSRDGHLFLGTIQAFDRLVYSQEFTKLKRWWTNREKIIEYPKDLPSGYSRHDTIHAIRIYNQFMDGYGAKAEIQNGGIGRQFVKIRLYSPFGKGLRYVVHIYGS